MSSKSVKFDLLQKKLLHDNVFMRAVSPEKDDIFIDPESYENKPEIGEVLGVGPGRTLESGQLIPMTVKVGDIVMFEKYGSTKFRVDGQDYYRIREEDIFLY